MLKQGQDRYIPVQNVLSVANLMKYPLYDSLHQCSFVFEILEYETSFSERLEHSYCYFN